MTGLTTRRRPTVTLEDCQHDRPGQGSNARSGPAAGGSPAAPLDNLDPVASDCAAPAVDDMPSPTNNPVTEPISAAAMTKPRRIFDSGSRILGRLPCSAMVTEIGQPDEDAGRRRDAEAAPTKLSTTVDPDVLPESRLVGTASRGPVGSYRHHGEAPLGPQWRAARCGRLRICAGAYDQDKPSLGSGAAGLSSEGGGAGMPVPTSQPLPRHRTSPHTG